MRTQKGDERTSGEPVAAAPANGHAAASPATTEEWWQAGRHNHDPGRSAPERPVEPPAAAQNGSRREATRYTATPLVGPRAPAGAHYRPGTGPPRRQHTTAKRLRTALVAKRALLVLCGPLMMVGSMTAWVSASVLGQSVKVAGTDHAVEVAYGVGGWATFISGGVLTLAAVVVAMTREARLKWLAGLAAFCGLGLAVYELVRILRDISKSGAALAQLGPIAPQLWGSARVGFGLILVLVGGFVALLLTMTEMRAT